MSDFTRVKVGSVEDLKIHVVGGNTATVVPELGLSIHPDLNNERFISNVEGVLTRVGAVLRFLSRSLERGKRKESRPVAQSSTSKGRQVEVHACAE